MVVVFAQPKKVGYFTLNKTMDLSAASVQLDPVIRMLKADANLDVTVVAMAATDTADLTGYDVIVVQESFSGSGAYLKPGASLALDTFTVPVIFNKTYALAAGRGFATGAAGGGAETEGTANANYVYLRVAPANQSNDLFKGVTFVGDSVALFKVEANDAGKTVKPDRFKALNYAKNVVILNSVGDTLKNTLLAKPAVVKAGDTATLRVCFNDIPAGSKVGSETLKARMITVGMNFGAMCGAYGSNITDAGLTIWRNAVYMAAGLTVPAEPAEFQQWTIGYFTLNKTMDASAATPLQDPIITMLQTNNDQWDLEVNAIVPQSQADLSLGQYDVIIIQESINGNDTILKPMGSLALEKLPVPTIYNKNYAFRPTRAFKSTATGTGAETGGILKIKVDSALQHHPLFTGITFAADSTVALVKAGANDLGAKTDLKALNYANLVRLTDTAGTLIALPVGIKGPTVGTVSVIPAGDSIGSEKLQAPLTVLGMNFGAICRDRGTNLTSAGLTLWRNAVHSALGLPIPTTPVPPTIPDVKVIVVTATASPNNTYDDLQIKWLKNNSLLVEKFIPNRRLGFIKDSADLADTLAILNGADLVIIGRSPASGDFADSTKNVWNNLKVPVILNSQWIARNNRAKWFDSGTSNQVNVSTGTSVGKAKKIADPIFAYTTFTGDSTAWSYLADDYISVTTPFNGDTVVYRNGAPLVVRFTKDSAFYRGATDTVRAPRTYFGFGNDANGPINFFPLTKDAQAAYYGEIMRITGNTVIEPLYYVSAEATITNITADQPFTPTPFNAATLNYTMNVPAGTDSVVFIVQAGSSLMTVTGAGVRKLASDSVVHSIYARAENTRQGSIYRFTIMRAKVEPGFEELTEAGISLYPNPAYDNLTIDGLVENSSIRIMNTVGQLVYNNKIDRTKEVINISSFKNGVYIIQIDMNGKIITTKFVKQ